MSLEGKVALITGAGRGIGLAVARTLAARGMRIAVNDLDAPSAERAAADAGGTALAVPADVTRSAEVAAMFERAEAALGPIWLLVNNAWRLPRRPVRGLPRRGLGSGSGRGCQGHIPVRAGRGTAHEAPGPGGRIVNVSSIAGLIVRTRQIAYCAAKAAVVHLTRCPGGRSGVIRHYGELPVPGDDTHRHAGRNPPATADFRLEDYEGAIPAGRMAEPEDQARHGGLVRLRRGRPRDRTGDQRGWRSEPERGADGEAPAASVR